MTTIIGIQQETGCMLVADSRTTAGGRPFSHQTVTKITKRGKWLVAGAGDVHPCDVIQHVWKPPVIPANTKDEYHFMITTIAPSIRDCIKESGYVPDKEDPDAGFELLLAVNGTIYQVDDSYSVYLRDDGLYGIGSGSQWALGAMAVGATWKQAMQTAAKNDVYTAPPFIIHRQEKK